MGRAGRAVDRSFGVLLAGEEDSDIQDYFVRGAYAVTGPVSGPGLLVDDMVDSRWTLTVVACLLREAGADRVYPVALADTSRADT